MPDLVGFEKVFTGDVVTASHYQYTESIQRWARNTVRSAEVVVFPKTKEDVVQAIAFAQENKLDLAVKCGGHSARGASSSEGLVIDLHRYFSTCKVDKYQGVDALFVGGGAKWELVDRVALEHGFSVIGGTVNTTGVSGLVLGGGFGWLTGEQGLAIDNLLEVTLVSASGKVVTANEQTNPDLFWAVRGGGGNFGIVVEFVLKAHPQRTTIAITQMVFPPPAISAIVEVLERWIKTLEGGSGFQGQGAHLVLGSHPAMGEFVAVNAMYNGSLEDAAIAFAQLNALAPQAIQHINREIPYDQLNALSNDWLQPANWYYTGSTRTTLPPPSAETIQAYLSELRAKTPTQAPLVIFEYYPMAKAASVSPDATAFRMRANRMLILIGTTWSDQGQTKDAGTENARTIIRGLREVIDREVGPQKAKLEQADKDVGYGNYEDAKSGAALLFGANYPRLQKIKKEWDPTNLFNKWYAIDPAE